MKKNILFLLTLLFFLHACKKSAGERGINTANNDPIVGTWKIESATFGEGEEFNGDGIYSTGFFEENSSQVEGSLQFKADGTIAITKYYWGAFNGTDKTILICTGMPGHPSVDYSGKWERIDDFYRVTLDIALPDWAPVIYFKLNKATDRIISPGQKIRLQKGQVIYDNTIQFVYVR